jgi:hypothetical protein
MCRSECERHHEVWDRCLAELSEDPDAKANFDEQMLGLDHFVNDNMRTTLFEGKDWWPTIPSNFDFTGFSLLACDSSAVVDPVQIADEDLPHSFLMGMFPNVAAEDEVQFSMLFPKEMATEAMYPETSSIWTDTEGSQHDMACYVPNERGETKTIVCPSPFLPPNNPDFSARNCIKPCPANAYSNSEYSQMWAVTSFLGALGFCLNTYMAATWYIGGKQFLKGVPFNLKNAVFSGLLYGVVETLPVLILGSDLPCSCKSEECTGDSIMCAVNRSSIYLLLSILINLCALTYNLYKSLGKKGAIDKNAQAKIDNACIAIPIFLLLVGYAIDTPDTKVPNSLLNVSRHGFNCRSFCALLSFPSSNHYAVIVKAHKMFILSFQFFLQHAFFFDGCRVAGTLDVFSYFRGTNSCLFYGHICGNRQSAKDNEKKH